MPLQGFKYFNTPLAKPAAPFLAAAVIVFYGVNSFANLMMDSEEYKNDPRNPSAKTQKPKPSEQGH